jgi:hypothetical protein
MPLSFVAEKAHLIPMSYGPEVIAGAGRILVLIIFLTRVRLSEINPNGTREEAS